MGIQHASDRLGLARHIQCAARVFRHRAFFVEVVSQGIPTTNVPRIGGGMPFSSSREPKMKAENDDKRRPKTMNI